MTLFWQYNKGILIGAVDAGQASPSSGSRLARAVVGRVFERLARAKDTVRRVRAYLRGRGSADLESITKEAKALTPAGWSAALPEAA